MTQFIPFIIQQSRQATSKSMSKVYTDTILLLGLSLALKNCEKDLIRIAKERAALVPRRERFYFNAIIKSKNPRKTVREILGKIPPGLLTPQDVPIESPQTIEDSAENTNE